MTFRQPEQQEHHPLAVAALVLDGLYCEEDVFGEGDNDGEDRGFGVVLEAADEEEEEEEEEQGSEICDQNAGKGSPFSVLLLEQDLFWEESELISLISKEKENHSSGFGSNGGVPDGCWMVARREAIDWILRVKVHYGFAALACVLAANYFDRFISSFTFQRDKPWMGQLAAVACLSLAAKMEETQVPLLLDLQVEGSKFVFEPKTVKRMELLVLSTLQWRMNPVTPISFFDHIIRRFGLKTHLHWEFLWRCERLILSVIADSRFMSYLPSIVAIAIMLHVITEVEPCNEMEYQSQLMSVLKISEDKVEECYELILELTGSQAQQSCKRKHPSTPSSPSGVIDASFSSDSSNDSWAVASSVSSSPMPLYKRRAQDQQMQLPSLNRMYVDAVLISFLIVLIINY